MKKVLVVGGGIAGTTLAISLQRSGMRAEIVDIANDVVGVGILLTTNAMRAMQHIALLDACVEQGVACNKSRVHDAAGNFLMDTAVPNGIGPQYPNSIGMERPALARVLRTEALNAGATIRLGLTVERVDNLDDRAVVQFTDGSSGEYDLVVGADGLYSHMRSLMLGDATPPVEEVGQSAWRWYTKRHPSITTTTFFHGRRKLGFVPLSKYSMYLLIVDGVPASMKLSPEEALEELRSRLNEFTAPIIADLLPTLTSDSYISYRPLGQLWVDGPWHRGRIALIGDAAHGVLPHLGNGGGMAIEDGIVLSEELLANDDVEEALVRFRRRRADRCRLVYENSMKICFLEEAHASEGEIYQLIEQSLNALTEPY